MTDDEMRGIFREMRDEPVPPDSLARVRESVAVRTRQERPWRGWAWKVAAALAAAASLVLVLVWSRASVPNQPPPAPPAPIAREEATPPPPPVEPPVTVARRAPPPPEPPVRPARRVAEESTAGGARVIRIETPDPDVVILLLEDRS
ncbi:MAG: hypothetical protein KIT09_13805 [Bryobacteraceae bacterium]|nr:hypothetical protein [Bryobacteraceae bacterium]